MKNRRHLIIIPIVHTQADFGSLGSRVPADPDYEIITTQYWQAVSEYVRNLPVDFSGFKIYQDGLPDTSETLVARIIRETQTPNYDLLRWLQDQGAQIMGTENTPLLLQEYQALQAIFNAESQAQKQAARQEYAKISTFLLTERDNCIAQRIKDTLPEGSTGILFLGLAHEVGDLLEQEITVSEPETLIGSSSEALRSRLTKREQEL